MLIKRLRLTSMGRVFKLLIALHFVPHSIRFTFSKIEPQKWINTSESKKIQGIRVQVRSVYIEGRSQPSKGQYFFAYRIRITNNSDRPVQLLRRHWIITDANGKTENVW